MRFRWNYLFLLILIPILIPFNIFAQEKMVLDLEKSLDLALENNPNIKMAEKELSKASAGIWEAYSSVLPQFDASVNLRCDLA